MERCEMRASKLIPSKLIPSKWVPFVAFAAFVLLAGPPARAAGCPGSGVTDLDPGIPVFGLNAEAACANGPLFVISVPNDASRLVLELGSGVGNANLFVKQGGIPTPVDFDYFSGGPGNGEHID